MPVGPIINGMSAIPPKADIDRRFLNVRFVPKADIARAVRNERGRQLRRPLSYAVAPIRRGRLAAPMWSERWAIENAKACRITFYWRQRSIRHWKKPHPINTKLRCRYIRQWRTSFELARK